MPVTSTEEARMEATGTSEEIRALCVRGSPVLKREATDMVTASNHPETCWCYGTGWRVELGVKCALPNEDPLLTQCTETESGGVRCEAWLTSPDERHSHFITEKTLNRRLGYGG